MDYSKVASALVENVGGKENIKNVTHCVTRVRFQLFDEKKVNKTVIEEINGVVGTANSAGQFQVIIGAEVEGVYKEVARLTGTATQGRTDKPKEKITIKGIAKQALDTLISCFVPAIPAIAGSGMIKVLAVLLSYAGVLTTDSSTYVILNAIGDGIFYFLPFIVAFNAAKKMETDIYLSMALAAILMYPKFATLGDMGSKVSFFGIGMTIVDYSAQALPIIFAVWLLKYVDKFADKVSPKIVKVFLRPMISLLVVAPIMLIIIGPISVVLGNWLLAGCQVMSKWGWIAVGINAAIFPLMVLTGTHNATIPLIVQMFAKQGFDPIFLTSGMAANMAEAGAAGAVALKTKNKGLRGTAISASVSALLGITEPALYGVNLRLKRPFAAVLLGSLLGGCYIGMIGLTAPTFVTPSILTAPIFVGAGVNLLVGLSAIPVCYFITFIITYLFGFEDIGVKENYINAPIKGEVMELEEVSDKAFSSKSMGDGFAIIPEEGKVVAPFDCDIEALFPTKHAIGLKRIDGLELLIHIGFDTVNLNGEFFEVLVKTGDHVKAGDTLITFDIAAIKNKGYEVTTPVIVTNSVDFKKIKLEHKGVVNEGEKVLYVEQ